MRLLLIVVLASCGGPSKTPTAPEPTPIANVESTPSAPSGGLTITGIEPERGDAEGGTYVRISGAKFLADGPRNAKVYFGSRQGTIVRFASDSELIVEAPGGQGRRDRRCARHLRARWRAQASFLVRVRRQTALTRRAATPAAALACGHVEDRGSDRGTRFRAISAG